MAIHYYLAQKAEQLRTQFIANYKATERNIFKKDLIVTQGGGMNEWLVSGATQELGIFANYTFLEPTRFISKIASHFNLYNDYAFSPQNIKWRLYILLENEDFKQRFPQIAQYYAHDEIKRVQLAEKVSRMFDNYTVFRESYLQNWSDGKEAIANEASSEFSRHALWQQWLWQTLRTNIQEEKCKELVDTMVFKSTLTKNLSSTEQEDFNYNSISLFALSNQTPYHREIIEALGQHTHLNVYMLNPVKDTAWIDDEGMNGNPFLASCNKQGTDLFRSTIGRANAQDKIITLDATVMEDTLLQRIHKDIYLNEDRSQDQFHLQDGDDSLIIASSFTEVREVEALYNYILKQFEQNPELKAHDVLVQITDMERYEPFIAAVFDNGPIPLPYSVSDTQGELKQSLHDAMTRLFELTLHDFKADSVMTLLEFATIRQRFGIEDMDDIRALISEASIRFGTDGTQEDESYLVSWQHGLKRLILGTAIKGGGNFNYQGQELYLCDNAEGDRALNIYRIKAFVDTIIGLSQTLQNDKNINDWITFILEDVVEQLFFIDDFVSEELDSIKQKLHQLEVVVNKTEKKISFHVFQELALKGLRVADEHKRYITGRITFAEMMPTRTIPYKVKAILGLNAECFPRQKTNLGFDLMALDPKPGDRSPRESDQYLFLDAVLSAREHLYLSYIGNSVKDNSELPPSLLVEELQSYIAKICKDTSWTRLFAQHPLHSFSKKYNRTDFPQLYSYLNATVSSETREKEALEQSVASTLVDLRDFIRFFQHPIKWYYNKVLQIYYNDDAQTIEHTELFDLDNLQQWQLKADLLFLGEEEDDKEQYIFKQKSEGHLPLSNMGRLLVKETEDGIAEMKSKINAYTLDVAQDEWRDQLQLGDVILTGHLTNLFDDVQLFYNMSKNQAKYQCEAWITHLFTHATGRTYKTVVLTPMDETCLDIYQLSPAQAQSKLDTLMDFYLQGQKQILPYTIKMMTADRDGNVIPAEDIIKNLKHEGTTSFNKDYTDPYIEKELTCSDLEALVKDQIEDLHFLASCLFPQSQNN